MEEEKVLVGKIWIFLDKRTFDFKYYIVHKVINKNTILVSPHESDWKTQFSQQIELNVNSLFFDINSLKSELLNIEEKRHYERIKYIWSLK